ncbi:MAG: YicC/YloC family endoribonuclease [Planctomycetota bacterium]
MLRSMTGYGSAQVLAEGVDYGVELRSVNGRYFKASIRLPELLTAGEADIEKRLRERLGRGSVQLTVRIRVKSAAAAYTVNTAVLQRYLEQARSVIGDDARVDVGTLLGLPAVCEPPEADDLCEATGEALFRAIDEAIDALLAMRRDEGRALQADLFDQCDAIEAQLARIEPRTRQVVADYHQRLLARVNDLVAAAKLTVSESDLLREVAVFAERSDINEEIARLRSHLEQFRRTADQEDAAGRKLDFISQEMLREANTMGSKANDAEIARAIVEIKTAIDRIKEQVQNVE